MTYTRWFAGLGLMVSIAACGNGDNTPMQPNSVAITSWELITTSTEVSDVVHVDGTDDYVVATKISTRDGMLEGQLDALRPVPSLAAGGNVVEARVWTDGDSVFVSTQGGPYVPVLAERRDGTWTHHWDAIGYTVYPIAASARDDVYLGATERVVHFDGTTAHVTELAAGDLSVLPAWNTAGQALWGLGRTFADSTHGIYQWNESAWELDSSFDPGELIDGVWGDETGLRWAVGTGIYEHTGITWTRSHDDLRLSAIAGDTANDLYAVGDAGTLLHFDGSTWSTIEIPTTANLTRISISAREVLIVTADGNILRGLRE